jgi:hypothetical protein
MDQRPAGYKSLRDKKAPCPGAEKNMTQPALSVESKMRFRESEHRRRCRRDTLVPAFRSSSAIAATIFYELGTSNGGTKAAVNRDFDFHLQRRDASSNGHCRST